MKVYMVIECVDHDRSTPVAVYATKEAADEECSLMMNERKPYPSFLTGEDAYGEWFEVEELDFINR